MKSPKLLFVLMAAGLLSSCGATPILPFSSAADSSEEVSSEEATSSQEEASSESEESSVEPAPTLNKMAVDHYNIAYCPYESEDPRTIPFEGYWSEYKSTSPLDFYYFDDQDELPYISLDTYAALLNKDLKEGYAVTAKEVGEAATIEFTKGEDKVLSIKFDRANKQVTRSPGSIEPALKATSPLKNSVVEYIQMQEGMLKGENLDFVYSWKNTDFHTFAHEGKNYFPFALLDLQLSKDTGRSFFFLGGKKAIYEVCDTKQYEEIALKTQSKEGTEIYRNVITYAREEFDEKFGEVIQSQSGSFSVPRLPEYLTRYERDSFYYVMDNFYGLGETLGYKSMAAFLNNTVYAERMLSNDGKVRAAAYSYACSILNDNHTLFQGTGVADEATGVGGTHYDQTLGGDRTTLQRILKAQRDAVLTKEGKEATEVRYSDDGKVAYFSFDEFAGVKYDETEGKPASINKDDTYLLFLKNLKAIQAKTGVEKVVIDDTINGGGYVAQLVKLLCLLSKDNSSTIYYRNGENNSVGFLRSKVDVDLDGKIDEADKTFGNDFKFYILTSPYSFSCGNAFPKYAEDLGLAKIIGNKSGGGECIVGGSQLPYGCTIGYSSNMHLGLYNQEADTFSGYEVGATPSLPISENFYDVNAIANAISKI